MNYFFLCLNLDKIRWKPVILTTNYIHVFDSSLWYKSLVAWIYIQPLHLICDYLLVLRVLSLHIGDLATRKRLSYMAVEYTLAGDQSKRQTGIWWGICEIFKRIHNSWPLHSVADSEQEVKAMDLSDPLANWWAKIAPVLYGKASHERMSFFGCSCSVPAELRIVKFDKSCGMHM